MTNSDDLLQRVLLDALEITAAERALIAIKTHNAEWYVPAQHQFENYADEAYLDGHIRLMLRTDRAMVMDNQLLQMRSPAAAWSPPAINLRVVIAAPLMLDGDIFGVLLCDKTFRHQPIDMDKVKHLETYAHAAAPNIHRALF